MQSFTHPKNPCAGGVASAPSAGNESVQRGVGERRENRRAKRRGKREERGERRDNFKDSPYIIYVGHRHEGEGDH